MSAPNTISIEKLVRLIGTPKCPILVDVRPPNLFEADPHLIPSSFHCGFDEIADEMAARVGERGEQSAIVICQNGTSLSKELQPYFEIKVFQRRCSKGDLKVGSRRNVRWFPSPSCHLLMRGAEPFG
jgi:rhodanese-related sulfurtransferase